MKYLSLFSGIGGFECALQQIYGLEQSSKARKEFECLGFSEIDKLATKVYLEHFPDHPALGDITTVDFRPFRGQVDLVVGGFPCQDLSSLRKLHSKKKQGKDLEEEEEEEDGLKGKRSGLFFEFLRCLEECKPKYFLAENVGSMSQANRDKISEMMGVEAVLLNSQDFTAQKRRRLFWFNFPLTSFNNKKEDVLCFNDILVPKKKARKLACSERLVKYFFRKVESTKSNKTRLEMYKNFFYDTRKEKTPCLLASGRAIVLDYRFLEQSDKSSKHKKDQPLFRKLAQVEAERLQGFPDGWTSSLSYTASIKRLGNAVTVPVVFHILSSFPVNSKGRR